MSKTLDAIRKLPHVAFVDDERDIGNSIIVTLAKGYTFKSEPDCGVQGFDTVRECQVGTARKMVLQLPAISQSD